MTVPRAVPLIENAQDFARAFYVSRETLSRLETYAGLLARWQTTHNLVAPSTLPHLWSRHFADSAQLFALAGDARCWLDLGSGAGFPGMVAAIMALERGGEVHLVEANAKKCAFLSAVKRETGAPVHIHQMRIEDAANRLSSAFDVVSARALASLDQLCAYAQPFMGEGTKALFPKGREVLSEIAEAQQSWNLVYSDAVSLTDPDGRILILHSLKRR